MANCRACAHTRAAHEHYRGGTNCSQCSCPSFRRSWMTELRDRLFHRGAAAAAPKRERPRRPGEAA